MSVNGLEDPLPGVMFLLAGNLPGPWLPRAGYGDGVAWMGTFLPCVILLLKLTNHEEAMKPHPNLLIYKGCYRNGSCLTMNTVHFLCPVVSVCLWSWFKIPERSYYHQGAWLNHVVCVLLRFQFLPRPALSNHICVCMHMCKCVLMCSVLKKSFL